jgi:hypothetical protein
VVNDSEQPMNRPDFTALLADIREAFAPEPAIYLTDDEAQVADEMMLAARALYAAYPREEVVERLYDHFSDTAGMAELSELIRCVAERDAESAFRALSRAVDQVAKLKVERRQA